MFGLSGGELLTLLVFGLLLMGPNRLPQTARQAAIFIKKARALAAGATAELRESLGPDFEEFDLTDLNPKSMIKKQISGVIDEHVEALSQPIVDLNAPVFQGSPAQIFSSNPKSIPDQPNTSETVKDLNHPPLSQIDPDLI